MEFRVITLKVPNEEVRMRLLDQIQLWIAKNFDKKNETPKMTQLILQEKYTEFKEAYEAFVQTRIPHTMMAKPKNLLSF